MKKNITLRDIANETGVSVSTVSRVLNNEKFVSNIVIKKVKEAVKKLNYEPHWAARSLRLQKTNIIGIIIPNIGDYFYSSIVLEVGNYFRRKGKELILLNTSNDEYIEEKAIKIAISKRVEGIILATTCKNNAVIKSMIENFEIPFVLVDNKIDVENVDFVLGDDLKASNKLIKHLIKTHGYKRIAYISTPLNESSVFDKLEGYKKTLKENNLPIIDNYIKMVCWKKDKAYIATKEIMSLKKRPEAICCSNKDMLIGCLEFLNEKEIKVPNEVALVTFDDLDFSSVLKPPVTTLERIDLEMGRKAAELLFKRIIGIKEEYKEIKIDSNLIIRKSCGCS